MTGVIEMTPYLDGILGLLYHKGGDGGKETGAGNSSRLWFTFLRIVYIFVCLYVYSVVPLLLSVVGLFAYSSRHCLLIGLLKQRFCLTRISLGPLLQTSSHPLRVLPTAVMLLPV